MYTTTKTGLGRLPWVLAGLAFLSLVCLFALSHRTVRAGKTTQLVVASSPATWKPGSGWVAPVAPAPRSGEKLSVPRFAPFTPKLAHEMYRFTSAELFDPLCGKLWKPHLSWTQAFAEHPEHQITFATNSRSMREDSEPRAEKPLLRVLVAGDSHTDGVCKNSESFPNLAEAALRKRAGQEAAENHQAFDPSSIEVLNAGKGCHTFYSYLGTLERNLDLHPDVFVVAVYGGNDFEEALTIWHAYHNNGQRPSGVAVYGKQVMAAAAIKEPALAQAFCSIKYFDFHPEQKDIAIQAAREVFEQTRDLCRERGIRLIVLYLPPWQDVEPKKPELMVRKLLHELELTPAALASTDDLADRLFSTLAELGIEAVDLRPRFKEARQSLYWNEDWHINLAGHQVVARALVKALSARQ